MTYHVGDILVKETGDIFIVTKVNDVAVYVKWGDNKEGHFTRSTIDGYVKNGVYSIRRKEILPEDLFEL